MINVRLLLLTLRLHNCSVNNYYFGSVLPFEIKKIAILTYGLNLLENIFSIEIYFMSLETL